MALLEESGSGLLVTVAMRRERRIGQNKFRDVQAGGRCPECQGRTSRMPVQNHWLCSLVAKGSDIFDFARDCVIGCILALATPATIEIVDSEVFCQFGC